MADAAPQRVPRENSHFCLLDGIRVASFATIYNVSVLRFFNFLLLLFKPLLIIDDRGL